MSDKLFDNTYPYSLEYLVKTSKPKYTDKTDEFYSYHFEHMEHLVDEDLHNDTTFYEIETALNIKMDNDGLTPYNDPIIRSILNFGNQLHLVKEYGKTKIHSIVKDNDIFPVTNQLDLYKVNLPDKKIVEISMDDQVNFPFDEITNVLNSKGKHNFVFGNIFSNEYTDKEIEEMNEIHTHIYGHNERSGFVIKVDNGQLTIDGNDEIYHIISNLSSTKPQEKLNEFLNNLKDDEYKIHRLATKHDNRFNKDDLSNLTAKILNHDKNLYLKEANSGGGHNIIRLTHTDSGYVFESDSEEFTEVMSDFTERYAEYEEEKNSITTRLARPNIVAHEKFIFSKRLDALEKILDENNKTSVQLEFVLSQYHHPVLEEEIEYETYNSNRAELRVITQQAKNKSQYFHYMKVSENAVSANISLGGKGELTEVVLKSMYMNRGYDQASADKQITLDLDYIKDKSIELQNILIDRRDHMNAQEIKQNRNKNPQNIAIDLIPTWNESENKLNYTFLEINFEYGYKGLIDLDIDSAKKVYQLEKHFKETNNANRLFDTIFGI